MAEPLPSKRIISQSSLQAFLSSPVHAEIIEFIDELNEACKGVKLRDDCWQSPVGCASLTALIRQVVTALLEILQRVATIADETPPEDNKQSRFGNPAFREFYDKVQKAAPLLHGKIPGLPAERIPELCVYFTEAWGNRQRIDYGSGMELNLLCWLLCLKKLRLFERRDYPALVVRVFWAYLQDMRKLQSVYWLEPAGSHGVWGLDDYAFLPFLFGASQLRGHRHLKPKCIHDNDILEEFQKDYMYLSCIHFINSIKTASLRWHSPMLDDISAVKSWDKINQGLVKMYHAEVLAKLPVAQHIYFGDLLPFPQTPKDDSDIPATDEHGHIHIRGEMYGDCCGIKVPSAFGAAGLADATEKENFRIPATNSIKRVPFD